MRGRSTDAADDILDIIQCFSCLLAVDHVGGRGSARHRLIVPPVALDQIQELHRGNRQGFEFGIERALFHRVELMAKARRVRLL